jgi:ferritin-like protein
VKYQGHIWKFRHQILILGEVQSQLADLIGLEGEGVKEIPETARIEDRNHFEALVPRIYELGGKLPEDIQVFHDMSACPPASLPKDPTDVKAIPTVLVEAE